MRRLLIATLSLALGCVPNPFAQYYQGMPDARVRPGYIAPTDSLQVFSSADLNGDVLKLMRRGYAVVGQSSFNAGLNTFDQSQVREQAKAIGASLVLVSSHYTNTIEGALPRTAPKTSTTTASGTATVYGTGGSATATGFGTSTTTTSQTVMVPYSIARGDFAALYFVRVKPVLGLVVVAIDDSTRQRLQTNAGVRVVVVVENSPAFDADILPGDILLSFGDERVGSPESLVQMAVKYQGQHVDLLLNRNGMELHKGVVLQKL